MPEIVRRGKINAGKNGKKLFKWPDTEVPEELGGVCHKCGTKYRVVKGERGIFGFEVKCTRRGPVPCEIGFKFSCEVCNDKRLKPVFFRLDVSDAIFRGLYDKMQEKLNGNGRRQ